MKKSFTLVELQVGMAIFVVLAAGLYQVLGAGMTAYMVDSQTLTLRQDLRNAMDRFVREVRECKSHAIMDMDDGSNRISFSTLDKVGVEYYRDGNQFVRRYPVTKVTTIAQDITYFRLALSNNLLEIEMQAEHKYYDRLIMVALIEKVRLRNE